MDSQLDSLVAFSFLKMCLFSSLLIPKDEKDSLHLHLPFSTPRQLGHTNNGKVFARAAVRRIGHCRNLGASVKSTNSPRIRSGRAQQWP